MNTPLDSSTALQKAAPCQVCHQVKDNMIPAALVRPSVVAQIVKAQPTFSTDGSICTEDLNHFRLLYIQSLLADERGELSDLDRQVLDGLRQHEIFTSDLNVEFEKKQTLGENMADKIAEFGGSWKFILCFAAVLSIWILINSQVFLWKAFDPFPFIFLNLILSCLAAIQAPVIMMSQNRQESKDRLRAEHDYRINLKAELEIRHLNEKIDHLLSRQWERLVEIQQVQLELMAEMPSTKGYKP